MSLSRLHALKRHLPGGGALPAAEFDRRHTTLVGILCAGSVIIVVAALAADFSALHSLMLGLFPIGAAAMAARRDLPRRTRSVAATLGLSACAALGVHISGGLIEAHFSFFVVVMLLTLYEDWAVFGLAVAVVLLHHGILGMVNPHAVFHSPAQYDHPWRWATIHAVFVAAAGIAGVGSWRLNEDVRVQMRATQLELERAATTDALTGLRNRRALAADLRAATAEAQATGAELAVMLCDLNGFKVYNDSFGHQAGDLLLQSLGRRLAEATEGIGTPYRLGGDEFCLLIRGGVSAVAATEAAAYGALHETGEGFNVTTSLGVARIPADASDVDEALRIADHRMYESKNGGRPSAGFQSRSVLLRALHERHPDLGHNLADVADLCESLARRLGLSTEDVQHVRHAGELHDIGKVAIPDSILSKPGPLDEDEWEFMRRHTIIGERIIGAAPSLRPVSAIVRATHEHWDGRGYPDGTAGEEIPIGARIVAVCDAFDAMLTDRPYRKARNLGAALEELRRNAGSQFDPAVVAALEHVLAEAPPAAA
jgi:diguanylate cyclase (GGDEF)-like protein